MVGPVPPIRKIAPKYSEKLYIKRPSISCHCESFTSTSSVLGMQESKQITNEETGTRRLFWNYDLSMRFFLGSTVDGPEEDICFEAA